MADTLDDTQQFRLNEAQSQKLTDWDKEPDLLALKQDFEAAKPFHDAMMNKIRHWNDLMYVRGSAKPKKRTGRSSVQPKLVRRQAEWRYAALTEPFLSSKDMYKVSPVTFEDGDAARQNGLVLNWQFRTKINRIAFIDNYIRSTVDDGTSIVRVGWRRVTKQVREIVPVYDHIEIQDAETLQIFQQALELKNENPRAFEEQADPALKAAVSYYEETQQATQAIQVGTEEITTEKVIENRPTLDVLNPNNVYIDPSCQGDLSKALFVIVSFETNKAELLKEPTKYTNLEKVNWEDNALITDPDHATQTPNDFNFRDRARKKVIAYEYWGFYDIDGSGELTPIVVTWIGDTIVRMALNPFPDQALPFVLVPYSPVKRELMGEPDAELLEDNQRILGATMRGAIDLLGRSANAQRGFQKGLLDPLNRRRYDNGEDYEFNPMNHPSQGVVEHKYPELPQSAMLMMQLQNNEAEAMTGTKAFSGGISGEAYGEVAAGIRGALDASGKREMAILRRLANGMVQIGQKLIAMNSEFLSEKEVVRVTNDEFVTIYRDDLVGQFDLEVDISTAEVDNIKAQDLGFILQTLGPKADPEITMLIMAEIATLKRMPELSKKLATWQPKPDPMIEQMKQLELQKLQAEVQELQSRAQKNMAEVEKKQTEADLNKLDFVEEESGVKHERNMQKQREQSRGNQNLAITKALTTARKEGEKDPDIAAAIGFNSISDKLSEATDFRG